MEEQGPPQDPPQGQPQGQPQQGDVMATVTMAFNLGVSARQQGRNRSVVEVVNELQDAIFNNLQRAYGSQVDMNYLAANTEYLLQIALLGFIVPSICAYEEDFKNRLFSLILAKIEQTKKEKPPDQGSNIILT
ncbi:hypothetical protein MYX76_11460 [Desulfobacterota bacterium AH_259_B03_O07]|nr:hypothetical protein [Desulfobacterota bacterium AH_259_B03_O07]